jgi:hypothetical protein
MSQRARQLYLGIIVLLSAIILPIVLLYSSGYAIDFKRWRIQQTGTVVVNTLPEQATITMEGIDHLFKSPAIINRIVPGSYLLSISKPNYTAWSTVLDVNPNYSTVLNQVILFLANPVEQAVTAYPSDVIDTNDFIAIKNLPLSVQHTLSKIGAAHEFTIQQTHKNLFTVLDRTNKTLWLINYAPSNDEPSTLKLDQKVLGYQWNSTNNTVMFFTPYEIKLYNFDNKEVHSILRQSHKITEAIWHPSSRAIIFSEEQDIKAIGLQFTTQPELINLFQADEIPTNLQINKKGTHLYFTHQNKIVELKVM